MGSATGASLGAVLLDLQCKFNVNFRQNLMQIVTRGKRAQTEVGCLSSAICVVGRLRAKACGGADLRFEAPSSVASEPRGPSSHLVTRLANFVVSSAQHRHRVAA